MRGLIDMSQSIIYPKHYTQDWFIIPDGIYSKITISFDSFNTMRYQERVKIYSDIGDGELVGVLHGKFNQIPDKITIKTTKGIKISFVSDQNTIPLSGTGFTLRYKAY